MPITYQYFLITFSFPREFVGAFAWSCQIFNYNFNKLALVSLFVHLLLLQKLEIYISTVLTADVRN